MPADFPTHCVTVHKPTLSTIYLKRRNTSQ